MSKFKVGQLWRCRDGLEANVYQVDASGARPVRIYISKHDDQAELTPEGKFLTDGQDHKRDLVELITDAP